MVHPLIAVGVDTIMRNTNRVRQAMAGEAKNKASKELEHLVALLKARYDRRFIEDMVKFLELATDITFEKTNNVYGLLATEPMIAIVQEENPNSSNYVNGEILIVGFDGNQRLIRPNGEQGNSISDKLRLATDDEIIGLGKIVGAI